MSENTPVNPAEIPVFTGNLELLDEKVKALSGAGGKIATAAGDVHTSFGGLRSFYKAPEAEQLFATTQPVKDKALDISSDMCTIAGALGTYASDIRPLKQKLDDLRRDAVAFREKIADDDKWREDGDLVEENNDRRNEIAEVWTQFQAAERAAHAKIVALVGGKALKVNDGSNGKDMYGYDAEALKQAKSLPWGDAVEESTPWWQVWEHAYDFGKGIIVDGVWGTIKGLGTLVGFQGWDAAGQAWKGLGQLATGLVITASPLGAAFWMADDKDLPGWIRDSRTAMKETGKALVAWDQWGSNPARAAGAVTFNVLTTVFTGGAGGAAAGAGKAGAVAKAISFAGKAGRAIDPTTYLFKGAGAGITKIGDVMNGLKGMGNINMPPIPEGTVVLPEGSLMRPDGTINLPDGAPVPAGAIEVPSGAVRLPEGTPVPTGAVDLGDGVVKLPDDVPAPAGSVPLQEGTVALPKDTPAVPADATPLPVDEGAPARYLDGQGNVLDENGKVVSDVKDAPTDTVDRPAAGADNPRVDTPAKVPAMAGAAVHAGDNTAVHLGNSLDTNLGDVGRVGDDVPARVPDTPGGLADNTPGGLADNLPTGQAGNNLPGGGADHLPGGGAGDHLPTNSVDNTPGTGGGDHVPGGHGDGPATGGHEGPGAGQGGTGGDHVPGSGSDVPPPPHDGGFGGAEPTVPDAPRGNLPDGSWAGENGLTLDRTANAAADDFMRRSAEAEPRITESMQAIAGRVDDGRLIGLEYRLKGEDSLKRKIATDMLEDIGMDHTRVLDGIKDSIRYTMEVPSRGYGRGVQQAIDDLQARGFENVTFKNTWDSAGYKGINSTWRDPVSGQVFELQFHTPESFAAKMDGHALYEKERLPGVSADELAAIRAEQSELFGKVPVPHDAGAIGLGSRAADDAVSALGKDLDGAADDIASVADDVGDLGDEAAGAADDAARTGDDAADGADDATSPYTNGPDGGWGGAGWVEEPSAYAASVYDSLRGTPNHVDVPVMARNTGLNESVIRQVKTHMMRQLHDVVVRPGEWKRGLFTPRDDIAALWDGARKGTLDADQIREFRNLMTHEYVESRLMKGGLPYLHDQTGLWRYGEDGDFQGRRSPKSLSAAGAHDLAPNPVRGGFGTQWQKLGLKHPKTVLADDLSNIDDFVKDIVQELRAKGVNVK
ncbi:hypothetical protein AB0J57_13375 [Streptomyces sp. NPDC049837]|uniref:hypothetical protein n=1 Tax=Streptomyces sp. NPDC049837 TaxID=3155277 RepID=UPI003449D2FC